MTLEGRKKEEGKRMLGRNTDNERAKKELPMAARAADMSVSNFWDFWRFRVAPFFKVFSKRGEYLSEIS